jgi:hypothetical protein
MLALLSGMPPAMLLAQNTGTLHGTITDPAGASVPAAKVTATLIERGTVRTAESDSQGAFLLPLLPLGEYSLTIEAAGFKQFTQKGIQIQADDNVRMAAAMLVEQIKESIVVTAHGSQVDTR